MLPLCAIRDAQLRVVLVHALREFDDTKFLKPCGSKPGIMYGMCKIHKKISMNDTLPPFRPILSAIGTTTYNLAKFFVPILREHTINEYSVKDSFSFSDEIRRQDPNMYMVSFDIKNLFTNIPLDETIDICINKAYYQESKVNGLFKGDFKQLVEYSIKSSCFVFNNIYCKQSDGVSKGAPLGPTLANIFLTYHENIWLDNCPLQFRPKYYRRYVDDIFLMFERKDQVKKFLMYMNSRHQNIQFTYEEEVDNKIYFLDTEITRNDTKLVTSLYRKSTFSGVYMNYGSHLPINYKKGLIHTLLYRAYNICSDFQSLHLEIMFLKTVWQKNRFPLFFIDSCVKKFFNEIFIKRQKNVSPSTSKKEIYVSLEFLGKTSLQVKKQLVEIFRTCQKNVKLNIGFKSPNRLKNHFRFKDQIPSSLNSKVIYKFTCNICNDIYIGETKRHLLVRQYEHLGKSIFTNKPLRYSDKDATSIRKHSHHSNHPTELSDFTIIGNASNNFHLKLKESLLIMKLKPSLNTAKDSIPLHLFDSDL